VYRNKFIRQREYSSYAGQPKKYSGYKSFSYLEAGRDYEEYELVKEIGRVPQYIVEVSKTEEERVWDILNKSIVISLHDHSERAPVDLSKYPDYYRQARVATGYEGLAASGIDAMFDGLQDGSSIITSKMGWKWEDVVYDLGMRLSDIAHQDFVILGRKG